jgi:glycyl-tRNA synthetase beta chain
MPDFLLEIGLEEVPARMLPAAQAELLKRTLALLTREQLIAADPIANSYSTPRRLAVLIKNVREQQEDITEETTGPAVKIAFKDGVPTPAAEAFARKSGVPVAELRTISTPKGDYLAATSIKRGRTASEVIAAELPKEIGAVYWAKNMYWRPGKPERFVRPVLWIACLLGDEVVPLTFAGKTAGRATYGHRVLSTGDPFDIVTPASYLAQLEGEYVLADVELRRHKIRKALDHVTRAVHGARWREDHALVDAVTHLTEWPDVLLGNFEPGYLELPEEVLVTVMRDHQKYFAVEDATGKLAPHFLTVTNIALTDENGPIIRQGNERVLRARFNDARFFWEFDQRTPLAARVKLLENVTFQKDLGSYAAKSERVRVLAANLANIATSRSASIDATAIDEAATLAKTDLTTELVKEFTELQGIIGGLYAHSQGISAKAADAIYDQYLPASAKDAIPRSSEGAVLGLADRIDTIAGMFALGMEPTGSKDPFALRRAANSIVKILAESDLPLKLSDALNAAAPASDVAVKLQAFFSERIDFYLREGRDQAFDVVKAVMAAGSDDLRDLVARAEAVTAVRGSADFLAVSAAFKRMKNILAQADFRLDSGVDNVASEGTPGRNLLLKYAELQIKVGELRQRRAYREALEAIATIRPEIDAFFEHVMVMDPNPEIRAQRLTLLATIVSGFSSIADFSEIVTHG